MRNDELNINNDELVDMVLLQAEAIQILIGKVEKLETGIDKLEKNLTDKIGQLEKKSWRRLLPRIEPRVWMIVYRMKYQLKTILSAFNKRRLNR